LTIKPPRFIDQPSARGASPGLVDTRRPERSSLVLSYPQDASEDGYLQASEIYGLHLDADLVVLSACETGLGQRLRGEGVLGLPRAFLFAGASNVVVSLWSVSDRSTSQFMQEFYRQMAQRHAAPAEALSRARASLRHAPGYAHPFYWAPFVLIGPG
jgi:CHAT domain-containing protein